MKENILVICSHSDDEFVALGGTLFKYAKDNHNILTIIFSHGEKSLPHLQEEIVKQERIKETEKATKLLKRTTIFLDIPENQFSKNKSKIKTQLRKIIEEFKPTKIFTHSKTDVHKDHRDVNDIVLSLKIKEKTHLYTFDVWNPMKVLNIFKIEDLPKLYVDTTKTHSLKIKALNLFESQKPYITSLLPFLHIQERLNGMKNDCKYAEVFDKIK
ncbi:hypothetical protein CL618_03355 [archaeon]|nr:hypothetical protein [archaeon]|tara:strand:- start:580 stop:1221 length:642 start_codon:yes stop_codon:yes gene_type:complete